MAGIRVAAGEERGLVERRGDDAVDLSLERERDGALDGAPREAAGVAAEPLGVHDAGRFVDVDAGAGGPTKTRSAASRTSRDAAAFAMISGPMPRTSPSVTASRALRSLVHGTASAALRILRLGRVARLAGQRVEIESPRTSAS